MQGRAHGSSLSERPEMVSLISRDQTRRAGTAILRGFAGREHELSGKGPPRLYGRVMSRNNVLAPPEEGGRVERLGKTIGALSVRGNVDHAYPLVIVVVADVVDLVVEMLVARRDAGILADRNCRRVVHPHAQRTCKG